MFETFENVMWILGICFIGCSILKFLYEAGSRIENIKEM
jgi:hypothetical protein